MPQGLTSRSSPPCISQCAVERDHELSCNSACKDQFFVCGPCAEGYVGIEDVPHIAMPVRITRTASTQSAKIYVPTTTQSVPVRSHQNSGLTSTAESTASIDAAIRQLEVASKPNSNHHNSVSKEPEGTSFATTKSRDKETSITATKTQEYEMPTTTSAQLRKGSSSTGAEMPQDKTASACADIPAEKKASTVTVDNKCEQEPDEECKFELDELLCSASNDVFPIRNSAHTALEDDESELSFLREGEESESEMSNSRISEPCFDDEDNCLSWDTCSSCSVDEDIALGLKGGESATFTQQNNDAEDTKGSTTSQDVEELLPERETSFFKGYDWVDKDYWDEPCYQDYQDDKECDDENECTRQNQPDPYQNIPALSQGNLPGFGNNSSNQTSRTAEANYYVEPSEIPANEQLVDNGLQAGQAGQRLASDNPNVILHELTTVSEFEVEGRDVRYLGSHIIPAAELCLDPQGACDSRIDSVSDKVELEKLKKCLSMAQEALEDAKRKLEQLYRQLSQVEPYNGPTTAVNSEPEQHVRALDYALDENQQRT